MLKNAQKLPDPANGFCYPDCKHLLITEFEQNIIFDGKKIPHICNLHKQQIRHDGYHPRLPRLIQCTYDNSERREPHPMMPKIGVKLDAEFVPALVTSTP